MYIWNNLYRHFISKTGYVQGGVQKKNTKMSAKDVFGSFRDEEKKNLSFFKGSKKDLTSKALCEDITCRFVRYPL